MRRAAQCDRDTLQVLNGSHLRLRDLHLDLIGYPRLRVRPIIRHYETAGRGRGQERPAHARGGNPKLASPLTIHIDVHAWIVQLFVILQIAKRANVTKLRPNLFRETAVGSQIRPAYINLYGSRGSKIHDLRDDVRGLKGELTPRKFGWQGRPQTFFEFIRTNARSWIQGHSQNGFVLAARPKIDRVDRVIRRRGAHVAQSDRYIPRPGRLFDRAQ